MMKVVNVFPSIFVSFGAFTVNGWMFQIEFALDDKLGILVGAKGRRIVMKEATEA